jgi:hypothetical protein
MFSINVRDVTVMSLAYTMLNVLVCNGGSRKFHRNQFVGEVRLNTELGLVANMVRGMTRFPNPGWAVPEPTELWGSRGTSATSDMDSSLSTEYHGTSLRFMG